MDDPTRLIHAPLGQPGSGRVRYGAAMAMFAEGRLSPEQLEVYREAAAHDARDPVAMLAERGLPAPSTPSPGVLRDLLEVATDYLVGLEHPGAAEVRAGLARRHGRLRQQKPQANPVVSRWLGPALASIDPRHRGLATAIAAAAPALAWVTYGGYPRAEIGESFATGHAYAVLMGEDAPFAARDFALGLFLIAPHVLYRDHAHAAPELYAPLTGPHGWRFGPDGPLVTKPAHAPVWNPPHRPHLTKVGAVPFLALYVWTRDVAEVARVIPARDWPRLEDLRLG
jgi:hypothetical protein